MIIKSLKLKNIRSYTDATVHFPLGTTLFEGDIGSGKSTILMAIEFALFGLGSEKGGALLRSGTKEGSVALRFEVDGEEFEILRSLERKGKNPQQGEAYLKTKEGTLTLSAREMKERVLEILNFNEPPDPKAQSVIYRYAVFTPQEEMKAILWMGADARVQTLRKAFRIEDYQTANMNASALDKGIRDGSKQLAAQASDLEVKKEQLKEIESQVAICRKTLEQLGEDEGRMDDERRKLKTELDQLQKQKEELTKVTGEIPILTNLIKEKNSEIKQLSAEVEELEGEINEEIQPIIEKLKQIKKPTSESEDALESESKELEKLQRKLNRQEGQIEGKITDYETIERKKVCPTCDRPADPADFKGRIELKKQEEEKVSGELTIARKRVDEIGNLLKELGEYNKAQEQLKQLGERVKKNNKLLKGDNTKIDTVNRQVKEATNRLEAAEKDSEKYEEVSKKFEELSKSQDSIDAELQKVRKEMSSNEATVKVLKNQARELKEETKRKEEQRKLSERLGEYHIWLDGFFVPTLLSIEQHVMLSISREFDSYFRKWFGLLVEDPGKEARIDEQFTPIIEQDGYEQDINYLSGGEKTSLALAYRFALNTIVQRVSIGMKSNLLILDEPTDGLSKEQLFKVREILNEIKSPQVIIVSHERELESFADQIIKVEKTLGVSKVTI